MVLAKDKRIGHMICVHIIASLIYIKQLQNSRKKTSTEVKNCASLFPLSINNTPKPKFPNPSNLANRILRDQAGNHPRLPLRREPPASP